MFSTASRVCSITICVIYLKVLETYNTFDSLQVSTHILVSRMPLDCKLSSEDHSTPKSQPTWSSKKHLHINITVPGEICQVIDMASFLQADNVRKELITCLS